MTHKHQFTKEEMSKGGRNGKRKKYMENIPVEVIEKQLGIVMEKLTDDLGGDEDKIPVHVKLRALEILSKNALTISVQRLGDVLHDLYMYTKYGDTGTQPYRHEFCKRCGGCMEGNCTEHHKCICRGL